MSMLTVQVDNLRLMARLVRDYDYKEISRTLREAADTIESLREKAQDNMAERDEVYSAGFDSGVKACLQQLEGILNDRYADSDTKVGNICAFVDRQWKEYES